MCALTPPWGGLWADEVLSFLFVVGHVWPMLLFPTQELAVWELPVQLWEEQRKQTAFSYGPSQSHHALGGKIVQTSFSCHGEFSCSYKSTGMGEEVELQPAVPSIPVSFSPLLQPLAHPEAPALGTAESLWASMLSGEEEEAER